MPERKKKDLKNLTKEELEKRREIGFLEAYGKVFKWIKRGVVGLIILVALAYRNEIVDYISEQLKIRTCDFSFSEKLPWCNKQKVQDADTESTGVSLSPNNSSNQDAQ